MWGSSGSLTEMRELQGGEEAREQHSPALGNFLYKKSKLKNLVIGQTWVVPLDQEGPGHGAGVLAASVALLSVVEDGHGGKLGDPVDLVGGD